MTDYSYSLDGKAFLGKYESREDAVDFVNASQRVKPGAMFYTALNDYPDVERLVRNGIDLIDIMEGIREEAVAVAGDVAADWPYIPAEVKVEREKVDIQLEAEIADLVVKHLKKYNLPAFCSVRRVEEHRARVPRRRRRRVLD